MTKMVFEQEWTPAYLDVEDGGAARIYSVDSPLSACMEVRLHSYDETLQHHMFKQFEGKRLRVTVEVVE